MTTTNLYLGDCLEILPTLPDASVDCVITDPPYPEIKRDYGRMSEAEWWDMMMAVCVEIRRLLKPSGSAVFILQPNSHKLGSMRGWLFEFQAWVCREWNMIQDAWWWNITAMPDANAIQGKLMRSSLKACVWAGDRNCYRDQSKVLWTQAQGGSMARSYSRWEREDAPSGTGMNKMRAQQSIIERGGVTPFNVLPIPNADSANSSGSFGHGAGTPLPLAKWWTRYICPPGGVVLDPFVGCGTMMLAALECSCNGIGIERDAGYFAILQKRIEKAHAELPPVEVAK